MNRKINSVAIYTRKSKNEYTESLAHSIHLAYSEDLKTFTPLNKNYGILFATATLNEENVIEEKGLKNPYLFRMEDQRFGILAIRVDAKGNSDFSCKGKVLFWTSKDLVTFKEHEMIELHPNVIIQKVSCMYSIDKKRYIFTWEDEKGNTFSNQLTTFDKVEELSEPQPVDAFKEAAIHIGLTDIRMGNILPINEDECQILKENWLPIYHIGNEVPKSVKISSKEELSQIGVQALYSDGSKAFHSVKWNSEAIDFSQNGVYEIEGTLQQRRYPFPLAEGYADPVIMLWQGKYYYLATNDNKNDIGLYVREGDTIEALFEEGYKEYLILDVDDEKDFIQTFWAPEFHIIGGSLYILFAVGPKKWGPQCHIMRLKENGCITNSEDWETPLRIKRQDGSYLSEDGITLDMTYFKANHQSCVVWSYRENIGTSKDTGSMLYIATIDETNPYQLTSEPVLLSRPLWGWENIQGTINNEGPYALITQDTVYITYSGGAAGGYTYALGMLSIPIESDFLDVSQWQKATTPVLSYYSSDHVYGPGHNSFFKDKDGSIMLLYHGESTLTTDGLRCTGMHRVHFNQKGKPVLNLTKEQDIRSKYTKITLCVHVEIGALGKLNSKDHK